MYQEDIRIAIDVGSTKVCSAVIRRESHGEPELLALNVMPCDAMTRGDLVNQQAASEVIRASVNEASQQCDLNFKRAYIGIGGKHVRSFTGWGETTKFDFATGVTEHDVLTAVRSAAAENVQKLDHLLYATPINYRIDKNTNFRKPPIGMHPDILEVEAHLIVCDINHYEALFAAVEATGIEPIHGGATVIAEAEHLLSDYERTSGAVMIDVGGSDTEIAVYQEGKTVSVSSLPVGGFHFTNDIAFSYEIPFDNAEAVKLAAGTVDISSSERDTEIDPNKLTGSERVVDVEKALTKVSVSHLLRERIMDMAKLFKHRIMQAEELRDKEFYNLAFTGGGAKLDGFANAAKMAMGVRGKVDLRKPSGIKSLPESVSDPTMSGAICVMLRALDRIERDNHVAREPVPQPKPAPVAATTEQQTKGWRNIFRR